MTQERKDELDKFAETLVAETQLAIEKFVVGDGESEPASAELLGEMKERGAEVDAELAKEMVEFRERVKNATIENLKKVLAFSDNPEHVDIVVDELMERAREGMEDEILPEEHCSAHDWLEKKPSTPWVNLRKTSEEELIAHMAGSTNTLSIARAVDELVRRQAMRLMPLMESVLSDIEDVQEEMDNIRVNAEDVQERLKEVTS